MAWVGLATITPSPQYSYSPPLTTGVIRIKHRIRGSLAPVEGVLRLRASALMGIGSNTAGLLTLSQIRRIWTNIHYEVHQFEIQPDYLLTSIGILGIYGLDGNNWQVEIEEWI
jgi:hypothetical protein